MAPAEVTSLQRTIAKSANYAILYGVSAFGLSQATKIDQKEAQRYISAYFATHPLVRAFIDRTLAEGRERGYVTTLLGRRRYLPDLRSNNPVARNAAERMAMNAPVQGTASDMIKIAMVRMDAALRARGLRAACCCRCTTSCCSRRRPTRWRRSQALAREIMEAALPLDVPIVVDVKAGRDWSRARERRFLLVGLTGGIATGKSTVSEILRRLGGVIIDADSWRARSWPPGEPALAEIVREFGPDVLHAGRHARPQEAGRRRLRRRRAAPPAGGDHPSRHPRRASRARLPELEAQGFAGIVFWDAPVMIE